MKTCFAQYDIDLDRDFEISFSMGNCFVETITAVEINQENLPESTKSNSWVRKASNKLSKLIKNDECVAKESNKFIIPDLLESKTNQLRVTVFYDSKNYESLSDAPIHTRSSYLSILGLISYLVDEPISVFSSSTRFGAGVSKDDYSIEKNLVIEGNDLTSKLEELLKNVESSQQHDKELIFSLLDRWRKARFLELESEENYLYNDETTLSYFHVLELVANLYSKEVKNKSKSLIENFCIRFNEEILSISERNALESETKGKIKLLTSILDKEISVYAKISYFLKKYDLFDQRIATWVKGLIDARNSVAHGRRAFSGKAIFPVQPFFPLIPVEIYPLQFLRILSAKVIAAHLGLSLYNDEWLKVHELLSYGREKTELFLSEGSFQKPSLLSKSDHSIVYGGLNELIISGKIPIKSCINFYSFYIDCMDHRDDFLGNNIPAIILLLEDTSDADLIKKITQLLIEIDSKRDISYFKFRDWIYYLDFHGFQTDKLEGLVSSGDIK